MNSVHAAHAWSWYDRRRARTRTVRLAGGLTTASSPRPTAPARGGKVTIRRTSTSNATRQRDLTDLGKIHSLELGQRRLQPDQAYLRRFYNRRWTSSTSIPAGVDLLRRHRAAALAGERRGPEDCGALLQPQQPAARQKDNGVLFGKILTADRRSAWRGTLSAAAAIRSSRIRGRPARASAAGITIRSVRPPPPQEREDGRADAD